jgi:hypothetical protein
MAAPIGTSASTSGLRQLIWQMRVWFWLDTLLVFVTGIQLFVLSEQTDRFFAWTIMPPLTAAFLGACYWASVPLVLFSSRMLTWGQARLAVPGVFVFTTLTSIATLLHADRFHFTSPELFPRLAAWIWLAIYVTVPPWLILVTYVQRRKPGIDPPRRFPLPTWLRGLLILQGVILILYGIVLFLAPAVLSWPWPLSPLTGRATAAWLVGIGVIALHMVWENDGPGVWAGMVGFLLLGVLQVIALLRYPETVVWGTAVTTFYLLFLAGLLLAGATGAFLTRRHWHWKIS